MSAPGVRLSDLPPEVRAAMRLHKREAAAAAERALCDYWERAVGVRPVAEYRFHPTRRWRFDLAFVAERVALEVEGGAFMAGRHTRGAGFREDLDKYGEAAALGWLVLRCLPETLYEARTVDLVRRTLATAAAR